MSMLAAYLDRLKQTQHRPSTHAELQKLGGHITRHLAQHPELLRPEYQARVQAGAHPLTGHCYVACEVLYHAAAKAAGYAPHVMQVTGGSHWYLVGPGRLILDPTRGQFELPPDYTGQGCGFLTKEPSARAQQVLRELKL